MRRWIWWALPLVVFAVVEGQTGSNASSVLAPDFSRVYTWGGHEAVRGGDELRVMSWNVDHGAELDRICAAMQRYQADLYLLQEVDWNTARTGGRNVTAQLTERLKINGAFAIEFEELSQERGGEAFTGQATLSRLRLVRSRVLRFERQSGFWKPRPWIPSRVPLMQRRFGNRIALVSEMEWNGRPLVVYNAHLESRSAGFIQEKQLDEILADAAKYGPETLILLGGDLNTKYLPSIFLHKLEAAGFHSALGEKIERTHRIAMALDWIFVRGDVHIESGAVEREAKGSDHYPVYAVLSFHGR